MLYIHCFHWSTGTYGVFRCHVTEILQFMQLYLFSEWRWQMQMMNLRQQGHWLDWWAWTWCESRPRAFSQPHPNPTEHLWEIYLWRLSAAIIKLWTSEYVFRKTPFVPWTSSIGGPELKPNGRLRRRGVVLLRCKMESSDWLPAKCLSAHRAQIMKNKSKSGILHI